MPAPRSCEDFSQHQSTAALLLPENSLAVALRQRERNQQTERNPPLCCPCNSKATRLTFGVTKQNPHVKFASTRQPVDKDGDTERLWRLQHPIGISLVFSNRPYVIRTVSYDGLASFPRGRLHQPNYSFLTQMPQKHPRLQGKLQQHRSNKQHLRSSEAEFWKRAHSHQDILQLVVSFLSLVTFFKLIGSRIYNPGDSSLAIQGGEGGKQLPRLPAPSCVGSASVQAALPSPSNTTGQLGRFCADCRKKKKKNRHRKGSATKPTESEKQKIKQTGGRG